MEASWQRPSTELTQLIKRKLSPIAKRYDPEASPIENLTKWRPMVLVLGNYSSGKSTLINEIFGQDIQKTGQAPTDDAFTVITGPLGNGGQAQIDGHSLFRDELFPFSGLSRHGQKLASHFRLRALEDPAFANLAIIDTPGMLDSVSEYDRGYDYQAVLSDLAQLADLILVLFDSHKAGTVRETYESLRHTLPRSTNEDRVIFVLNRVDECPNLNDLLRVYGTLCWNLSQMTGRKDIPSVLLSHSSHPKQEPDFLPLLKNQREELKRAVLDAPKHRLAHILFHAEERAERLYLKLELLKSFMSARRQYKFRSFFQSLGLGLGFGLFVAILVPLGFASVNFADPLYLGLMLALACAFSLGFMFLNLGPGLGAWEKVQVLNFLKSPPLKNQAAKELWQRSLKSELQELLLNPKALPSVYRIDHDQTRVQDLLKDDLLPLKERLRNQTLPPT